MRGPRSGQEQSGAGVGAEERPAEDSLLLSEDKHELYGSVDSSSMRKGSHQGMVRTPLPWNQLGLIIFMRLAEPIAYTQIFPYINLMIRDLGLVSHPSQAGYYSGLVDSVFAFAELLTVMAWGRLSDRIGRKPVLIMGLAGAALTTLLFGFSKTFAWALTMRALAGGLSGNVPVLQSVVGDITDKTNEVKAFSIFSGSWNIAQISGPYVGGTFAKPEYNFPDTLGKIELFQRFPYLLPCLVSGFYTFVAVMLGLFFLRETRHRVETPSHEKTCIAAQGPDNPNTIKVATDKRLAPVLLNYFLLSFIDMCEFVVFTLYASSPVSSGGLSRNPSEIGKAMAFSGLSGALLTMFALPSLQNRIGIVPLYKFLIATYPVHFLLFPLVNLVARHTVKFDVDVAGGDPAMEDWPTPPAGIAVWVGIATILFLQRTACMCFSLNQILVKNAAPSPAVRGVAFGLSHLANCISRALAPTFICALFSFSQDIGWFGGNTVWILMVLLSLSGIWSSNRIQDYGS